MHFAKIDRSLVYLSMLPSCTISTLRKKKNEKMQNLFRSLLAIVLFTMALSEINAQNAVLRGQVTTIDHEVERAAASILRRRNDRFLGNADRGRSLGGRQQQPAATAMGAKGFAAAGG